MAKKKYAAKQVIEAIETVGPIKIRIAKFLGCHRNTVDNYIKRYPTVAQAYDDADQEAGDMVHSQGLKKAMEGHWPAIEFFLRTKYKDRGFTTKTEHEITGEHKQVVEETHKLDLSNLTAEELELLVKLADRLEARGQS